MEKILKFSGCTMTKARVTSHMLSTLTLIHRDQDIPAPVSDAGQLSVTNSDSEDGEISSDNSDKLEQTEDMNYCETVH